MTKMIANKNDSTSRPLYHLLVLKEATTAAIIGPAIIEMSVRFGKV